MRTHALILRHPATGEELFATRLETADGTFRIEGKFSFGWIGRLTPDQLDFLGLLLKVRNNLQKLASDLGVAYNTVRSRLDDVVDALEDSDDDTWPTMSFVNAPETSEDRLATLDSLESGDIDVEEAIARLKN